MPSLGKWTEYDSWSFEQSLSLTVTQSGFLCVCAFPFPCMDLSSGDKIEHDECRSKAITSKMHNGSAGDCGIWPRTVPCEN